MTDKELRHKLKTLSKPSIERICEGTGLSDVEAHIIMFSFLKEVPADVLAQNLNMSVSTYTRTKRKALTRICDFLDHNEVEQRT